MKALRTGLIPGMAAVAVAYCWLSALATAHVSSRPGARVAPASAQTTMSASPKPSPE